MRKNLKKHGLKILGSFVQVFLLFWWGWFFIPAFQSVLSSETSQTALIILGVISLLSFYGALSYAEDRSFTLKSLLGRRLLFIASGISAAALSFLVQFLLTSVPISKSYFVLSLLGAVAISYVLSLGFPREAKHTLAKSWVGIGALPIFWMPFILIASLFAARHLQYEPSFGHLLMSLRVLVGEWSSRWAFVEAFPGLALRQPMNVVPIPGARGKYFVLERAGVVKEFGDKSQGPARVILDISDRVTFDPTSEDGALGLALHPKFASGSAFLFVHYTATVGGINHNRLSRFSLDGNSGIFPASKETILIEQPHPFSRTHNGGSVEFGPDGFLYLSLGDYSGGVDVLGHSQRVDEGLFSGIIRIDVDMQGGSVSHAIRRQPRSGKTANYFIPNDNPFVGRANSLEEYWAIGLRNPFRFSFDTQTGELWTGDVGQEHFEEVNIVTKGSNHQWSYLEGVTPFRESRFRGQRPDSVLGVETPPVFVYPHSSTERVIIGGQVYRGAKYPDLQGRYLYADNASSSLNSLIRDEGRVPRVVRLATARAFERYALYGISSLYVDDAGEIYITLMGSSSTPEGKILQLVRNDGSAPIPTPAPAKLTAEVMYEMSCARCHGKSGDGKGEAIIGKVPRNFRDTLWQSSTSDERIEKVIREGGASVGLSDTMPAWGDSLSESDIRDLRQLIRGFADKK